MQVRLREGDRQQHSAAVHHCRTVGQRGEIPPGKFLPRRKALGGAELPCPGVPAAAAALHGIPAGPGIFPPGGAGVRSFGGLAALALCLFACGFCRRQPELLFRGKFSLGRQGAGRARLDEPCHKVAFAALTGPDAAHLAHVQRQAAGAVCFTLAAEGVIHVAQRIGQRKLRVALQEGCHLSLVLFRRKGAGGVYQLPARCQHSGSTVQNFRAQPGALLHQCFAVLLPGHRLLAEHALAGAGRIHQYPVEKLRQRLGNAGRRLVEHHGVGHTHPLQIALEDVGAGGNVLVAHQNAPPLQSGSQLTALAAGGRAHVQHPHTRLHAQQRCRRGRRRLLRVEHARVVVRVPTGLKVRLMHHERRPAEGRRFQREIGLLRKLLRRGAQRRDGHAALRGLLRGRVQCIEPLSQQGTLPLLKIFRRHSAFLLYHE